MIYINRKHLFLISLLISILFGCTDRKDIQNLVPNNVTTSPNYWCTWYWQNYLVLKGQPVVNPDPKTVYTNVAAREELNEETIFGENGMAKIMLPKTRNNYFFLIDHGWQVKQPNANNTFFNLILDTSDFPRYANLEIKDRIKQMNLDIKELGWKGLGLWVRGSPSEDEMRKFVEWSKYAQIEYWKIDGGDTKNYYATQIKKEIYPSLALEYVTGAGPLTPLWEKPGLNSYPSGYNSKLNPKKSKKALEVIKNSDVFRTYDAAPLLVSTTTMQRICDILTLTAGNAEYRANLNIQDDCNIAAALGLLVAVKRHPMNTPRMYKGKDFHLQIAGDRHVDKRLNEMDRFVIWQKIAPAMPAGYGTFLASDINLIDSIKFEKGDTWLSATYNKMVHQSAPAIMARNISMPIVKCTGLKPYVLASKFPNGAIGITTEGRVTPEHSWVHPKADIILNECNTNKPIGIFGHYNTLSLVFVTDLPKEVLIYAQDLLADRAVNITGRVTIKKNSITIPGELIDEIGTNAGDEGDISAPGMVLKVVTM